MNNNGRTVISSSRSKWNERIFHIIKAIDTHVDLYLKTLDPWHMKQAEYLRRYIYELKDYIIEEESQ